MNSFVCLGDWIRQSGLPRLEAHILLRHIGGFSHVQLITQSDFRLPENLLMCLNQAKERRILGEPMAYILGEREFYGRVFRVSPAVLIPRPETEHLVEAAIKKLPKNGLIWDLGTGSGAIAVTLACERTDAAVWASDISEAALQVAADNAAQMNARVRFIQGDWFDVAPKPQSVDVLVSNPPYIEVNDAHLRQGDLRFEPQGALTDFANGLSAIERIAKDAPLYLKKGGWLLLEHGFNQGEDVRAILNRYGFIHIETERDLAGLERVSLGQLGE
ncbi:peptide chain release factor N(5)-glutamine methyltransferase [Stenoxybacter acetivorans]|uniref:peptide chain release factor N(5)-glutamine methyltransferase n=1 Tax=Stenoxybacter acetivorans TaxID=422441 RepID=UPI0005606BC2|nr:peptide chain release factor N(5)-glutamine methyltransferase [Stenoxybacter acetivorans]